MDLLSYVVFAATIACVAYMIYVAAKGDPARDEEQAARDFFDVHGRWPDEPEDAAVARPEGYADVDRLPEHR